MKKFVSLLLALTLLCSLSGCGMQARDLTEGVTARPLTAETDLPAAGNIAVTDFALRLLRACEDGEKSTVLSPLSVLCALGMTVNGAEGETKAQMEAALGMTAEELNRYLGAYLRRLNGNEKVQFHVANSVWLRDDERFTVEPSFLQTNADVYDAGIYAAPFDDTTVRDINRWVKKHTDGMIDGVLEEIPTDAVMYLINALAFEAEWMNIYEKPQVRPGTFTRADGTTVEADFMHSTEYNYLSCDSAEGFLKLYKGGKYAFAALLPREGMTVSECLAALDGTTLQQMLSQPEWGEVVAALPKFELEGSFELSEALEALGMTDAFDANLADFSALGSSTEGDLFLNRVLHRTYLSVAEKGTRAGAVTVVEVGEGAAAPSETHYITLDRPFICMLVDTESGIPFFMGTVMEIEN